MDVSRLLAVAQLIVAPILLAVALGVRFAGGSRPLNVVDYRRVQDPAALHRWAGARLLLLPIGFAISGLASLLYPTLAIPLLALMVLATLVVGVWVALGAERFCGSGGAGMPR